MAPGPVRCCGADAGGSLAPAPAPPPAPPAAVPVLTLCPLSGYRTSSAAMVTAPSDPRRGARAVDVRCCCEVCAWPLWARRRAAPRTSATAPALATEARAEDQLRVASRKESTAGRPRACPFTPCAAGAAVAVLVVGAECGTVNRAERPGCGIGAGKGSPDGRRRREVDFGLGVWQQTQWVREVEEGGVEAICCLHTG